MVIFLKDGNEYRFGESVPTRWLFENFEDELVEGKMKYKEKEAQKLSMKKDKALQSKEKDKKLAAIAIAKLSKKELAALKKIL